MTYDETGNRTLRHESTRQTFSYDVANQLTTMTENATVSTYTYDLAGNQLVESIAGVRTTNTWDDENRLTAVDFNAGTLRVSGSLQRVEGRYQLVPTKTARSRRTVTMPSAVSNALRAHKVKQNEERLQAGPLWQNTLGLVFTTPLGAPLDPRSVVRHFKASLTAAGLPGSVRWHDLRHTAASLLLSQGVPLRVIMGILGHSTITLTANTYAHLMPELQRDAADRMDAVLGG